MDQIVRRIGIAFLLCCLTSTLAAQSPPTFNVLTRMTIVHARYGYGTTFSIDVDKREYWITAKHILTLIGRSRTALPFCACPENRNQFAVWKRRATTGALGWASQLFLQTISAA